MRLFRTVLRHGSRAAQAGHLRVGSARPDGLEDTISADDASLLAWRSDVSGHARTVVVPLSNPDTATDLLRVAHGLLPDAGGRIHAVAVHVGDADAERASDLHEGLGGLVEVMKDRLPGCDVTFRTRSATSVARGILDAIRDSGADVVVLGVRQRAPDTEEGGTRIGPVVESVIETAACDVVVFGPGTADLGAVERVVVAVDAHLPARNAVRVATLLRRGLHIDLQLVHVHEPDVTERQAHAQVAGSVTELVSDREAVLQVIAGEDVVEGLVPQIQPTDMVMLGIGHQDRVQGLAQGSMARRLLDRLDVPVLTVTRAPRSRSDLQERLRRAAAWLHPRLTDVEQETMRSFADGAGQLRLDYVIMTLLSGVIATFGLLLDSAAVIIGAMLVAPLMNPLQAFGIGVVAGRARLAVRSVVTVMLGAVLIVLFGILCGWAVGVAAPTPEMLSRGSPSLLDAVVALAAGMAGAYATARKDIPAALAGVAIAAALVPPISTIGLGLAAGRFGLAMGATLLFLVNVVCIAVVAAVMFQWLGLRPADRTRTERGQLALAAGSVGLLVGLLVLLVVVGARRVRVDERPIQDRLAVEGFDIDLVEVAVVGDGKPRTIRVVLDVLDLPDNDRERLPDVVRQELADQLGDGVEARLVLRDVISAQ